MAQSGAFFNHAPKAGREFFEISSHKGAKLAKNTKGR
jgi:hypothetical protein